MGLGGTGRGCPHARRHGYWCCAPPRLAAYPRAAPATSRRCVAPQHGSLWRDATPGAPLHHPKVTCGQVRRPPPTPVIPTLLTPLDAWPLRGWRLKLLAARVVTDLTSEAFRPVFDLCVYANVPPSCPSVITQTLLHSHPCRRGNSRAALTKAVILTLLARKTVFLILYYSLFSLHFYIIYCPYVLVSSRESLSVHPNFL